MTADTTTTTTPTVIPTTIGPETASREMFFIASMATRCVAPDCLVWSLSPKPPGAGGAQNAPAACAHACLNPRRGASKSTDISVTDSTRHGDYVCLGSLLQSAVTGSNHSLPRQPRAFLRQHQHGCLLLRHVAALKTTWPVWAAASEHVRKLPNAQHHVRLLATWAEGGPSAPVSEARTGIIALPLLLVLQLGQYFRYLEHNHLSHAQFLVQTSRAGGIQGCCGGEPPALSIACAIDEAHVVENAAVFLRILLGVGAYIEAADDWTSSDPTILALRLKYEGQGEQLVRKFPGVYISAITEPRSLSFVGSSNSISRLSEYAHSEGMPVDKMDVTGKAHNPENAHLVPEFMDILRHNPALFNLPEHSQLQVTVRSNRDGTKLSDSTLMEDMIIMMLADCCNWYELLTQVARDLKACDTASHHVVIFGLNDSVPLSPFNKQRLQINKFKAHTLILDTPIPRVDKDASDRSLNFSHSAIAIVGVSCRLPQANNLDELWDFIAKGGDAHQKIPLDRIDPNLSFRAKSDDRSRKRTYYGNFLHDIKGFDHSFFGINSKEAAALDPQQRILMELSYEALESSGYLSKHSRAAEDSIGCFIGSSLNEYLENTSSHPPSAYTATGTIRAFLCGRLSHQYGWSGPSEVIDTACSSSLVAINRACRALQTAECEIALAGGVSVMTHFNNFLDLGSAGFLSPTGQCKPFDATADGYCRSEGAGLVVLKRLNDAISAGDSIFGVIPSIATNQGGTSASLTVPSSSALEKLYRTILVSSAIQPTQISYVEAHGTGTQAGDPIEMDSIRSVFGGSSRSSIISVGSIKGNIGHCESAAGVVGLLKVLAMLRYGKIPPQANHSRLNPKIRLLGADYMEIAASLRDWNVPQRAALVNSYGAGGSNCALICCEYVSTDTRAEPHDQGRGVSYPILLSAASIHSLVANARALAGYLSKQPKLYTTISVAFTLDQQRKRHRYCFSSIAANIPNLVRTLQAVNEPSFEWPSDRKATVLALSGQYSDRVALDPRIYESFPAFQGGIDACDNELVSMGYESLKPAIFQKECIASAVLLQCSIFAVQYASARCWIEAGFKPDAIIGHSLGELVALAVCEALSLKDALKLVASRAWLVDTKWTSERGCMLAVHDSEHQVKQLLSKVATVGSGTVGSRPEIACYNAPKSFVLAGTSAEVQKIEQTLASDATFIETRYQRLSTTHAFHSALTDSILPELAEMSHNLPWAEPKFPLETCTQDRLPSLNAWSATRHARSPVYFSNAISRIEQRLGSCIWLEAGFNTPIVSMVRRSCSNPNSHVFLPVSTTSTGDATDCVGSVISACWQQGISVRYWAYLRMDKIAPIWIPPYQFQRQQHWIENIDRATEAYQQLANTIPDMQMPAIVPPAQLVVRQSGAESSPGIEEFLVNTGCRRFQEIVKGHSVLRIPLCPAPLHMECVSMALRMLSVDVDMFSLTFKDLRFHAPLGLDPSRSVHLRIEVAMAQGWTFSVSSALASCSNEILVHCTGMVFVRDDSTLITCGRLMESSLDRVRACSIAEKLKSRRAYTLFSKVMHYAPFFKGIASITLSGNEALAVVELPKSQPAREESLAWQRCDSVLIDAFVSVVGLLVNSSDTMQDDEVAIATGIERVVLGDHCHCQLTDEWTVYAKFSITEATQPFGDVFIYNALREVVAMMTGVQFTRVISSQLAKSLMAATSTLLNSNVDQATNTVASSPETSGSIGTPVASDTAADTQLKATISQYTGIAPEEMPRDITLVDLGVDSLTAIDFAAELEKDFQLRIRSEEVKEMTLNDLTQRLGFNSHQIRHEREVTVQRNITPNLGIALSQTNTDKHDSCMVIQGGTIGEVGSHMSTVVRSGFASSNPFEILLEADNLFDELAELHGYSNYHSGAALLQQELTLAYILDAFSELGSDITPLAPGNVVRPVSHVLKHEKLVNRLWDLLQNHKLVVNQGHVRIRSREKLRIRSANIIYDEFMSQFPRYLPEARLLKLCGENLARCLKGEQDPLMLLFGNPVSNQIMVEYYANSPMVSTLTDQLVAFVIGILREAKGNVESIQILEVGAGTGATTARLAAAIEAAKIPCRYTFTDISSRMVAKARDTLSHHPWIDFQTFDLERQVPDSFRRQFHMVIGTNCVHATSRRTDTCHRLSETLVDDGLLVLSEGTRSLEWFDICFGLLDGWWVAENGTEYPLQPAKIWMETLREAGFESMSFSRGFSQEAYTQQLLVGSMRKWPVPIRSVPAAPDDFTGAYRMETMTYKEVDTVQIQADVFIPRATATSPLPIALMIHGGGHFTLSRKAIRPAQTRYLISHGFLPVSIDYRLCPEVDIVNGPMADVRDGYVWACTQLPLHLLKYNISVDCERVVLVGWSTGGHLALSAGWTTKGANVAAPTAILSFYAPVDFESKELDNHASSKAPPPGGHKKKILSELSGTVLTNYEVSAGEGALFFGLRPGDPRSDLILSMCRDSAGLSMLLHTDLPSPDQVAAISPLAQLRLGQYQTPTFIIHSRLDEVVLYDAAERFISEMRNKGILCGILALESAPHLHDLRSRPGENGWEEEVEPGYKFLIDAVKR